MKHSKKNGTRQEQFDCMKTRGSTPVNTYGLFMDADGRALSRCHPKPPIAQLIVVQ